MLAWVATESGDRRCHNATLKFDDSSGIQLPAYPGDLCVSGTFKPTNYCSPSHPELPAARGR